MTFGLGADEPLTCLCVVPRGRAEEMDRHRVAALEAEAWAELKEATDE